jgi:preprotein translocase subunit SecD
MLVAVMMLLNATWTLPGIAGLILTLGMGVDSNVLIFERVREELRSGKTVRAAIDFGYERALLTIIDAHVTVIITALILFTFGTGPIKGFATTLSIGIFINLFTALVGTRLAFDLIKEREPRRLSI